MVGTRDLMIHPDAQRCMAQRAGALFHHAGSGRL